MRNKVAWDRLTQYDDNNDLQDLRRGLIVEIAAGVIAIGWIVSISAFAYNGDLLGLLVSLILFSAAIAAILLRENHLRIALILLIAGMISATAVFKIIFPHSQAQFFLPLSVVVSSLLVSYLAVFLVATIASLFCLFTAALLNIPLLDSVQVWLPILLIYMTAFASWLSSRQIHSVLGWMQTSYAQAREWLEQLRDERMTQARTIKILEEAYARIERLNYQLTEARMAAEEARKLKAEFAANISHELRTPLNLIIGFSETMANAPETYQGVRWTPTLRGDIDEIYRSSRHLSTLIDDILDLSALEVRRLGLNLEVADAGSVVEEAASVVRGLYHAKRLYLKIDTQPGIPQILMDATRIRQVLINLLSNASRYTMSGGVTITTRVVDSVLQISVSDTGVGIAPRDIPKVFEEFGQVDGSLTRMHGGTGLGVPLSKRLVEMHGGDMWLESKTGQGTTFHFTLPLEISPPDPEARARAARDQAARDHAAGIQPIPQYKEYRRSLLVAEADPLLMRALRRQLSKYDLVEMTDLSQLPSLVQKHRPAALIVDAPDTNWSPGLEIVASIAPSLPVVQASLQGNLRIAQQLGIQDYLIKPISRDQLLDAIASIPGEICRVLILDNETQILELFTRMLESAGSQYEPVCASDGETALRILRSQPIDLVLLDLLLPGMTGLDVLRAMKNDPVLSQMPVIMISGQYPEDAVNALPLSLHLFRPETASLSETINYLEALLSALPKGKILQAQPAADVPAFPEGAGAPPASSNMRPHPTIEPDRAREEPSRQSPESPA